MMVQNNVVIEEAGVVVQNPDAAAVVGGWGWGECGCVGSSPKSVR